MKLILKIFLLIIFSKSSLLAETFNSALKRAYNTNPELNAERESINISEQELMLGVGGGISLYIIGKLLKLIGARFWSDIV